MSTFGMWSSETHLEMDEADEHLIRRLIQADSKLSRLYTRLLSAKVLTKSAYSHHGASSSLLLRACTNRRMWAFGWSTNAKLLGDRDHHWKAAQARSIALVDIVHEDGSCMVLPPFTPTVSIRFAWATATAAQYRRIPSVLRYPVGSPNLVKKVCITVMPAWAVWLEVVVWLSVAFVSTSELNCSSHIWNTLGSLPSANSTACMEKLPPSVPGSVDPNHSISWHALLSPCLRINSWKVCGITTIQRTRPGKCKSAARSSARNDACKWQPSAMMLTDRAAARCKSWGSTGAQFCLPASLPRLPGLCQETSGLWVFVKDASSDSSMDRVGCLPMLLTLSNPGLCSISSELSASAKNEKASMMLSASAWRPSSPRWATSAISTPLSSTFGDGLSKKFILWCSHSAPRTWIYPPFATSALANSAAHVDFPDPGGPAKTIASIDLDACASFGGGEVSSNSTSTPHWSATKKWYAVSLRRFDTRLPRPAASRLTGSGLACPVSPPLRNCNRPRPKSATMSIKSPSCRGFWNSGARSNFGERFEEKTCSPVSAKSTKTGWSKTSLLGPGIGWQLGHCTSTPNNKFGEMESLEFLGSRKSFNCQICLPWKAARDPRAKPQAPGRDESLRRMMPPLSISSPSTIKSLRTQSIGKGLCVRFSVWCAVTALTLCTSSSSMSSSSISSSAPIFSKEKPIKSLAGSTAATAVFCRFCNDMALAVNTKHRCNYGMSVWMLRRHPGGAKSTRRVRPCAGGPCNISNQFLFAAALICASRHVLLPYAPPLVVWTCLISAVHHPRLNRCETILKSSIFLPQTGMRKEQQCGIRSGTRSIIIKFNRGTAMILL